MLFSRTKKYVGLFLALTVVLGCFIFNPEDVKAYEGVQLNKVYSVTQDDYEYCFDEYCAAFTFTPSEDGYYMMCGSVRMTPFYFVDNIRNMIAHGYRGVESIYEIIYLDDFDYLAYDNYSSYYLEAGKTYYLLHDMVDQYESPYGEFFVRKVEKYICLNTCDDVDAIKDEEFTLWIELDATADYDSIIFNWYDDDDNLLKTQRNVEVAGITLNTNDYFSDLDFARDRTYYPVYCTVHVDCESGNDFYNRIYFPVHAYESALASGSWAEPVGNPYAYVANFDTAGKVLTVNAGSWDPYATISYQWYMTDDFGYTYVKYEDEDTNQFSVALLGDPIIDTYDSGWCYRNKLVKCVVTFVDGDEVCTKTVEYTVDYGLENEFIGNTTITANYGDVITFPVNGGFSEPMQDKGFTYWYQWVGKVNTGDGEYQFGTMNTVSIDTSMLEVEHDNEGAYSVIDCTCHPYLNNTPYILLDNMEFQFRIYYTDSVEPDTSGIAVNSTNFPDKNFRKYVSEYIDVNHSGYLSKDEIDATRYIDVSNKNISNLTGINYFGNVRRLYCNNNQMSSLDVSKLANLLILRADGMGLTSIDLSGCRVLKVAYLHDNNLTSINIDGCPFMTFAYEFGPQAMITDNYKYYGVFDYYTMVSHDMISGLQLDLETTVDNLESMEPGHIKLKIIKDPEDIEGVSGETGIVGVGCRGDNITYQWQYQDPDSSLWRNAAGVSAKTASLEFKITQRYNGRKLRCIVSDGNETLQSGVATVTVINGISITTQPENYIGLEGTTAKFSVVAEGDDLTYQWQLKKGNSWANQSSGGATTPTFSVKAEASRNGKIYRCVITDSHGRTATTDEVSITIKEPSINITKQPTDLTAVIGSTAKFNVEAEGEGLTYQWQLKKGSSWANQSSGGAATPSFSVKAEESRNGKVYRCLITDANGEQIATNPVTLTVKEPSIIISQQPSDCTALVGTNAKFTVAAEGEGLTYQWQLKKGNSWANQSSGGATTATFSVKAELSRNGKVYRCLITNADGEQIATNPVTLTVKEPSNSINITVQPENCYAPVGTKAVFKVEAEGEGLTYQWQLKKGSTWADQNSGGATTDTFTVKADASRNGKVYRCLITDINGEQIFTDEVTLTVLGENDLPPVSPTAGVAEEDGPIVSNDPPEVIVPANNTSAESVQETEPSPAEESVQSPAPAEIFEPAAEDEPVAPVNSVDSIG